MARFLITGGAGYIGSVITKLVLDHANEVLVIDDLSTGKQSRLDVRVKFEKCDIRDASLLARWVLAFKPDVVIHCAALISVIESNDQPRAYFDVNATGTLRLLEALSNLRRVNLLFSSTAAVYAPSDCPVAECSSVNPSSVYGWSKLFAEKAISEFASSHSIRAVNLRYFNVVGSSFDCNLGKDEGSDLFTMFCKNFYDGESVHIFGKSFSTDDGYAVRDFIHVEDLAAAHLSVAQLLMNDQECEPVLNVGYGHGSSVLEVFKMFSEVTGMKNIGAMEMSIRPGELPYSVADASKLLSYKNWNPKCATLRLMVESAWNYHTKHRGREV